MGAAADRLDRVARFDAEGDGAAFDAQNLGRRRHRQADRRRRDVADVEVDAEALMAGRKQVLDRVERRRFDHVDHHRRRQHRDAPGADKGGRMLGPDHDLRGSLEAGMNAGKVDHGGSARGRTQLQDAAR